MKKIILFGLISLLTIIGFVLASYDSSTGKATFRFTKGWNLYPILGGENVGNNCQGKDESGSPKIFAYLYSSLSKRYAMVTGELGKQIEEEQKTYGIPGKQYLYPVGGWFYYTAKDCDGWITYKDGGANPYLDIVKGWQFVAKLPFMKKYSVTFGNCTIEKFNQWDNTAKDWKFRPSETSTTKLESLWNSIEPGEVFVIKFASDCTLGYSLEDIFGIPTPPPLE
ncbi:hypothetical protein HZB88_03255 [archaeon]|nr:hypothetical protein [archaeon]